MNSKSGNTRILKRSLFVCTSILFMIGIVLFLMPAFFSAMHQSRTVVCKHNLRTLARAVLLYAEDYDQTLPDGKSWVDQTASYLQREQSLIYKCPELPDVKYSYAYHKAISSKPLSKIISPETTPMLYDSITLSKNATDLLTSLPKKGRHSSCNFIVFTDWHLSPLRTK